MKTRRLTKQKWKVYGFVASLLFVAAANFLIFWVYVNFSSILMAFKNVDGEWSLINFKLFFNDAFKPSSVVGQSIINTLIFFIIGIGVQFPLSLLFSYFLHKKIAWYKFFRVIFFLPSIISAVVMTSLFRYIVNGPITQLLGMFYDPTPMLLADSRYTLWTIVFYVVWTGFGVNLVLFNGAMARIPHEIDEYSRLEGVGFFRELWQVTIPLIWPTISTVILLAFVGMFNASGPILLFTEGKFDTYTISYWIYECVTKGTNVEYAAAVGIIFTAIGLPLVLGVKYGLGKVLEDVEY